MPLQNRNLVIARERNRDSLGIRYRFTRPHLCMFLAKVVFLCESSFFWLSEVYTCAVYITLSVQFSTRYTWIIGYSGTFMCRSRTQGSTSMLNAAPTERPRAKRQPATLPHAACVAMHGT